MAIRTQPALTFLGEPMTGRVVDDEEDLATSVATHELAQELEERDPVEHRREPKRELPVVERNRAEYVSGLAQAVRIDPRLHADTGPRAVKAAVLPEAGFVLEDDYSAAVGGVFLIAGSRYLSQISCASRSARASRLRGRCTEKPSW